MESLWSATANLPVFPALDRDISTDVLIIGGGMAGILCAEKLRQRGINYVLVEAEKTCGGITKNTTAKITSQHGLIYDKMIRRRGVRKAGLYYAANQKAVAEFRKLCAKIDCGFEICDAYVFSKKMKKLLKEQKALKKLGENVEILCNLPLPVEAAGAVGALRFRNQAQFNPLKFIAGILPGLRIYESTPVRELIGTTARTDHGRIAAKKIIVTTHFPFLNKHGSYFLKQYQHRSYVIALEGAMKLNGMYVDEAKKGMSFRNSGDFLLIGGGDHRTGKKGGNWTELRAFAKMVFPNATEKFHWATQDCMTLDSIPYIGKYSASTKNHFVATGFNKWGMTSSMVAANLLADLVEGKRNPYERVFSPSRSMLHFQLLCNGAEAVINLLTPSAKRCPHLGCALHWNAAEHSWDCACHGSRFTQDGKLIDNPATGDLKKIRQHG